MIWVLKLFWSAFTGDLFKFYTVLPNVQFDNIWSSGSSHTGTAITDFNSDTLPSSIEVFTNQEFTYTYWVRVPDGSGTLAPGDNASGPTYGEILYVRLFPQVEGANVTVTNFIQVTESLIPDLGSQDNSTSAEIQAIKNSHSGTASATTASTVSGFAFIAGATISGYYTVDELFPSATAKYVPRGESDLSTPNISLGGNQVNYSGKYSEIPQGFELYEMKPDSTQQSKVNIKIQYQQKGQGVFTFGFARRDGADAYIPITQNYSTAGTFLTNYYATDSYRTNIERGVSDAVSY